MAILNQQKSMFVPVVRIVNIAFFYFFFFCRASPPISCACTFFILQNDKTCYDFSENSDFLKKHPFSYKIAFSTLHIPKEFWWH